MSANTYKNLKEATHQDRGIVVYDDKKQIIVCNWTKVCPNGRLPIRSGTGLRSNMDDENCNRIREVDKFAADDICKMLYSEMAQYEKYDPNGDLSTLLFPGGLKSCVVHKVESYNLNARVFAPAVWHEYSVEGKEAIFGKPI